MPPQLMPPGTDVTVPVPVPVRATPNAKVLIAKVAVTDAAAVKVTSGGVMNGVGMFPRVIGSPHSHTEEQAQAVICQRSAEEATVAAIMEDDEHPHHEASREDGQQKGKPISYFQTAVCQIPQNKKWNN